MYKEECPAVSVFGDWATPKGLRRDFFCPPIHA
jgi:hypothetical protein